MEDKAISINISICILKRLLQLTFPPGEQSNALRRIYCGYVLLDAENLGLD